MALVRVAALLGLFLFGFVAGLVSLDALGVVPSGSEGSPSDPPPSAAARVGAARPGEVVHGAGAIGLFAIGVLSIAELLVRPWSAAAALRVLAVSAAWLATVPIVGDPNNVGGQAGPLDPIFLAVVIPSLVAALSARPWRRSGGIGDRRLLALAGVAVVPAAWFAVDQALIQRNTYPPTADPHHNAHWWVMAIVALAVVLVVASGGISSVDHTWTIVAPATAFAIGLASLIAPSSASAVHRPWAVLVVAWSIAGSAALVRRAPRANAPVV